MQHVPPIVVKHIDARARVPRGLVETINTCGALDGSPVDPRRVGVAMAMFSGVAGFVRDELPKAGGPAQPDQAGARWPLVREEAPKEPRTRLSNAGEGARAASRSLQGDARVAPLVENTIIVADNKMRPGREVTENQPPVPLPTGALDAPLREQSTLTLVSSPSGPSAGPEVSSGGGQRGPSSDSSSAQYFVRSICSHLDQVEKRLASRGQATALEQKMEEALSLFRRLEPSEAEKAIMELESKCARFEGDLEVAVAEIEELKKERLVARVEELGEENLCQKDFA
ncbi:hypothetical protein AXF42_Ash003759 [Apostasia shenzhenica]|uniref:Uncharacterized protein n=1 Tax=Apostasia shenzhenica TaxID=1088818 RepID=A0A2I0AHU6_9ASPA|nr:hypothetical protein AXF42_Ash003759 [Apostasia shenzhenica]